MISSIVSCGIEQADFYKVRKANGELSDAREAIGFIPWMYSLAAPQHAVAWRQLRDPAGFWAPRGLTTAERRHPQFRTHGVGTCEWDGAVWPFATSQTLTGLANVLRGPQQEFVTREDYFETLLTFADSHQRDGAAYLGEYHDEQTGEWLIPEPKAQRSRYYNHSTFNDLVITGLVGLVPQSDEKVVIDPLLPAEHLGLFLSSRRALPRPPAYNRVGPHRRALRPRCGTRGVGRWPAARSAQRLRAARNSTSEH